MTTEFDLGVELYIDEDKLRFFVYIPEEKFKLIAPHQQDINNHLNKKHNQLYDQFKKSESKNLIMVQIALDRASSYEKIHKRFKPLLLGPKASGGNIIIHNILVQQNKFPDMKGQEFFYMPKVPLDYDKENILNDFNKLISDFIETIQEIEQMVYEKNKPKHCLPQKKYFKISIK